MNPIKKFAGLRLNLPDGRIVLQRRSDDAKHAPNRIGLFGGWVDGHETPHDCIVREISEETSLDVDSLAIGFVDDYIIPPGGDFTEKRHFYLYEADIPDESFSVYEGKGAEAFTMSELRTHNDLNASLSYLINLIDQS